MNIWSYLIRLFLALLSRTSISFFKSRLYLLARGALGIATSKALHASHKEHPSVYTASAIHLLCEVLCLSVVVMMTEITINCIWIVLFQLPYLEASGMSGVTRQPLTRPLQTEGDATAMGLFSFLTSKVISSIT